MFKDIILTGAVIGLLADAVKLIVNLVLFLLNYTNVVFWQITASRFLDTNDLFVPTAYLIGGVADITVSAALGVVFILIFYLTGKDYLWIKGAGFGLLVWVGLFGTLLGQTVQAKIPQEPSGIIVTIIAHTFFGLSLAGFTQFFYSAAEKSSPRRKNETIYRFVPVPAKKIVDLDDKTKEKEDRKNKKPKKLKDLIGISLRKGHK